MRPLPDPELYFRDARDFIFTSALCRRALTQPNPPNLAVFLQAVLQHVFRLSLSCHLPEFTDHGLSHLCSLVDRLSHWSRPSAAAADGESVLDALRPEDCAVLLLGTLFHDIGMLSQRVEDMPEDATDLSFRAVTDIPTWVRRTHVDRLERLVRQLFSDSNLCGDLEGRTLNRAFRVARAHAKWPWEWKAFRFSRKDAALASMLAVADLLDEDATRCDTSTLIKHRRGSVLNCAHWIRHALTTSRLLVSQGKFVAKLARPPGTGKSLEPVFDGIRNHYRLALLYNSKLKQIGAKIQVEFCPVLGIPRSEASGLRDWNTIPGFQTETALTMHLFSSLSNEALADPAHITPKVVAKLRTVGIAPVDLSLLRQVLGEIEIRSEEERVFHAMLFEDA